MKNILFLAFFIFVGLTAAAQSGSASFKSFSDTNDTLGANSTFTYDFNTEFFPITSGAQNFTDTWSYSVTIEADSLSGAAADSSTILLQVSDSPMSWASPIWTTIEDDEIDGTATQVFHYTGDLEEPRLRLLIYSKSGTKAIALRTAVNLKRKYKTR